MEKSEQRSSVEPEIALDVIPALAHQPAGGMRAIKDPMPNSVVAGTFFYRVEPEHPITHPDVAAPKVADGIVQPVEDATRASTSGARSMLPEPVNVSLLTRMFSPAGKGAQCVGVPAI